MAGDLSMLIESANAPIIGIDTMGKVTEWNKKAMNITGYSKLEMLGYAEIPKRADREIGC